MDRLKLVILAFVGLCVIQNGEGKHKLVAYWGQNAIYNYLKEPIYWEKDLVHFCKYSQYDVVVLAFMDVLVDPRQYGMPALNFAYHCGLPVSSTYPHLLRCTKIEEGIKECQRQGKQVLMSLGGATGSYGFANNGQAKKFATTLWNLLFEGNDLPNIRPFGSAVLDGINLDIEGGSSTGYSAFVRKFREYTSKSTTKNYIVSGAPQCPFPDAYLGPSPGKALGDVPTMFDEIYIQFYNNYCHAGSSHFYDNLNEWLKYSADNNGPMIYVGVPSHINATYVDRGYYRTPDQLATIYQNVKDEPRFGGFMIWDASFDQNFVIREKHYSEHIADLIGQDSGIVTQQPITLETTQPIETTTRTEKTQPMETTNPVSTAYPETTLDPSTRRHKLVAYWGQNAIYNYLKEQIYWEKDLVHFCRNSQYDVVILAFMNVFVDRRQYGMPALNFAYHCGLPVSSTYPHLLRCPKIEEGIKECQRQGKQVLMSLGGATGSYGFANNGQATKFATTLWDLLFEGTELSSIRPFGSAVLDGIDLDIEGGSSTGYSAFVRKFREYTSKSTTKNYIVSGAPQCPFPDAYLGPSPGKALGDVPTMFDEIYIQFYNNYCHTGSSDFYENLDNWLKYSADNNGPLIYVGIPSHVKATYHDGGYFRTPDQLATIYQKIKDESRFGGFMIWDASFDQNHVINGKHYSEYIADLIGQDSGIVTQQPITLETTQPIATTQPTETTQPIGTTQRITTTSPSTGKVSCIGLHNKLLKHPKDCTKFIHCSYGLPYTKSCRAGLHFNCKHNWCDWPYNVDCSFFC